MSACAGGAGRGRKFWFLLGASGHVTQQATRVDRVRRHERRPPETPEDDPMNDSTPDASSQLSWDAFHEQTKAYVTEATQQLQEFYEDERRDRPARMLALLVMRALGCLDMTLLHVGALERRLVETKTLMRDFMKATMELAGIEDEIREHLEERLEQVEYATVAEGQAERLREQLAGDVLDVIADKLKGEEGSEDDAEGASENGSGDDSEDDS